MTMLFCFNKTNNKLKKMKKSKKKKESERFQFISNSMDGKISLENQETLKNKV